MGKLVVRRAGPPPGTFRGRFLGVETSTHVQYGAGLRFLFEVVSGPHAGLRASRVTPAALTLTNAGGRMLSALTGRPLRADEAVDIDEFIGREYILTVEETPTGATRVATVVPVPAA
jgi:hypothetical protein